MAIDNSNPLRIMLDAFFQGDKRLFVFAFNDTANSAKKAKRTSHQKYFHLTIFVYFLDQPIGAQVRKYNEISKIATRHGNYYTAVCFLGYQYLKDHYQLIAVDHSEQKR